MIDPVAIYGAIVATAVAAWQAYTWRRDRTVRVNVDVSYGVGVNGGTDIVFITLTNNSTFPVRWTQAGIDLQDGSGRFALVGLGGFVAPGYELPAVVASHDSHQTAIQTDTLAGWGFDLYRPIIAQARLGTGQVFKSGPKALLSK